jgi:hypothetical protein
MKKAITGLLFAIGSILCFPQSLDQQLNRIFECSYNSYLISKGDNRPDFDRRADNLDRFIVSLFYGIPPETFMKRAGWTQEMLASKIKLLTEKGWIISRGNRLIPTVFVVSEEKGKELYEYAIPIAEAIARSIEESVPSIKVKFKLKGLDSLYKFDELSFLILSDVLLDNWQLMKMESAFLKQENRPERHGKFYYAEIIENSEKSLEPCGIYGNQSGRLNDTVWLNIYGNNRIVANGKLSDRQYRDSVLAHSPRITQKLDNYFEEVSADYRPILLKILEENREYSMTVFRNTGYADQIRFEEFFIWWYHFIYTKATNILADRKVLKIPESGNFYYL